jgi:hypothetical protein
VKHPQLLDHRDLFHVCHVVGDIDTAIQEWSGRFGLTWLPAERQRFRAFVPGREPAEQESTTTWSLEGPVHIELGEIGAGPIEVTSDLVCPHHFGYWCDDVAGTRDGLLASGWAVEFEVGGLGEGPRVPFVRSPRGYSVELVPRSSRPQIEALLSG